MPRAKRAAFFAILCCVTSGCSLMAGSQNHREEFSYQIVRGDTLHEIGQRYGVTAAELQRHNNIADPRQLIVGQIVKIPAVGPIDSSDVTSLPTFVSREPRQKIDPQAPLKMISVRAVKGYIGNLALPVENARYSSGFGWRWRRFHEGADLAARKGTPILAAHDGTVVFVSEGWQRYGKVVVIKGDGLVTVYGHNSRNHVEQGDAVRKGDHIADVGATGDTTGPHLHFETRILDDEGRFAAINPFVFYPKNQ